MALYQNFTTSSSGTITIPGPIIGTHTSNTIANIFTASGNVGINMTNPAFTLDVNGTIDATTYTGANISISGSVNAPTYTGANISISGSVNAATNIAAIGNITNGGYDFILGNSNQSARGNSGSSRALVKESGSTLKINFAGDFTGGTEVQGPNLSHAGFFLATGNSNTIGNIFTTGGNVGIGTTTPESRFQVVLPTSVDVNWRNLTFRGTSLWGDGITTYNAAGVYTSGTLYGTLMSVMLTNPHITSHFGDTARIRFGKAGGVATGAWWETGVKTDGSWHIGQSGVNNNFIITTGGNIGIGLAAPTQIMQMQRSGSDNYLKIDAGGVASNFSGIMLTEHNLNWGWALRHDAGTDLLYISYQDNTPSFTNTTIFNRSGQIGINKTPAYTLDINGNRLSIHNAAGTGGGQNLFEGINNENARAQIVLSSMYSDLVIASSQANDAHGSTLTFATYNPSNKADYRKWVINQGNWGARAHMLEFGYNPNNIPNPHSAIDDTFTVMTLDGSNDRLGVGTRNPSFKLDVNGDFRAYGGRYIIQNGQDGGTGRGIYMWTEGDTNWGIYMGNSGAGRSLNGGTAPTGVYGFSAHAMRFRTYHNSAAPNNGWIFETGVEGHAASIRGDGHMYVAGNLGLGVVSPSYKLHVSGDTLTNGWFRTTGDTGLWSDTYSRGMRVAVTGEYGNIETHGAGKNDWEGFSIDGRYVFMSADNNQCGIFNDVDNQWIMYFDRSDVNNKYVQLRHNNNIRLQTTSAGVYVNGEVDIQGTNVIELGIGLTKETNAGKIGYNTFDSGALDIIGAGTNSTSRTVRIWDTLKIGGWTINANDGHLRFYYNGNQTYVMHNDGQFWSSAHAYYNDAFVKTNTTIRIRARKANEYLQAADAWDARLSSNAGSWEEWYIQYSDRRLKSNIITLEGNFKTKLLSLNPVNFSWTDSHRDDFGFIAQEVFEIFPKLRPPIEDLWDINHPNFTYENPVDKDGNPVYYTLNYGKLTPYIIQTMKELNNELEETKSELQSTKETVQLLSEQNNLLIQEIQKIKKTLGIE